MVALNNGNRIRQGATGGITAAPVTAQILKRIFPILGITKNLNFNPEVFQNNEGKLNLVSF